MTPVFKDFVKRRVFPNSPAVRGGLRGGRIGSSSEFRGSGAGRGAGAGALEEESPRGEVARGKTVGDLRSGASNGEEATFVPGSISIIDSFYYLRDVLSDGTTSPGASRGRGGEEESTSGSREEGPTSKSPQGFGRGGGEYDGHGQGEDRLQQQNGQSQVQQGQGQRLHTFLDVGSGTIYRYRFNRASIVKVRLFLETSTKISGLFTVQCTLARSSSQPGHRSSARYGARK